MEINVLGSSGQSPGFSFRVFPLEYGLVLSSLILNVPDVRASSSLLAVQRTKQSVFSRSLLCLPAPRPPAPYCIAHPRESISPSPFSRSLALRRKREFRDTLQTGQERSRAGLGFTCELSGCPESCGNGSRSTSVIL